MDTHRLKSFPPEIRSRLHLAQKNRHNQGYFAISSRKPMHTVAKAFDNDHDALSRVEPPSAAVTLTHSFPTRNGFLRKLSLLHTEKHESYPEHEQAVSGPTTNPSKLQHLNTGMLRGKVFRLPALGTSQITPLRRGSKQRETSGGYSVARLREKDSVSASFASACSLSESEDVNETLLIEPYPFESSFTDYEERNRDESLYSAARKAMSNESKKSKKKPTKEKDPTIPVKQKRKLHKHTVNRTYFKTSAPNMYDKQLSKELPVKKLFNYSRTVDSELREHIPPRIPGGKLKPVYKRTREGEIFLPAHPLLVKDHDLLDITRIGLADEGDHPDLQLMRRHGEDLQTFLERKRKTQLAEQLRKKILTVSFKGYSKYAREQWNPDFGGEKKAGGGFTADEDRVTDTFRYVCHETLANRGVRNGEAHKFYGYDIDDGREESVYFSADSPDVKDTLTKGNVNDDENTKNVTNGGVDKWYESPDDENESETATQGKFFHVLGNNPNDEALL